MGASSGLRHCRRHRRSDPGGSRHISDDAGSRSPSVPSCPFGPTVGSDSWLRKGGPRGDLHVRDVRRPGVGQTVSRLRVDPTPWSGGGKVAEWGLADQAKALGVEVIMWIMASTSRGWLRTPSWAEPTCLGMAGGDGSQALVASIAIANTTFRLCACQPAHGPFCTRPRDRPGGPPSQP